jgi:hypothetical protein
MQEGGTLPSSLLVPSLSSQGEPSSERGECGQPVVLGGVGQEQDHNTETNTDYPRAEFSLNPWT